MAALYTVLIGDVASLFQKLEYGRCQFSKRHRGSTGRRRASLAASRTVAVPPALLSLSGPRLGGRNLEHGPGEEQWAAHAASHFRAIKNAWRNRAMHGRDFYDQERATEIYEAVRALMRHLAGKLSEDV